MIHEQPMSMGICWSGRGVEFWGWDGGPDSHLGSITLTNFGQYDHGMRALRQYPTVPLAPALADIDTTGFGGYDHDDGGVRRFSLTLEDGQHDELKRRE
jgi:hypothetical protein